MRRQDAPPWLVAAHLALLATSQASAVPTTPLLSRVSRRGELRVGAFVLLRQIAPGWRLPALRGIRTCQPAEITRPTPRTVTVEHALGYPGEYPARSALHHRRREPPGRARRGVAHALARRAGDVARRRRRSGRAHDRAAAVARGRASRADHRRQPRRDAGRSVRPLRPARQ